MWCNIKFIVYFCFELCWHFNAISSRNVEKRDCLFLHLDMVPQFTLALTSFMILSIFKLIEAILKIIFVYIKNLISHYGCYHEPLKYYFSHSAIWLILKSTVLDYHIYKCKDYVMEYDKYINNILDTLFLSDI